MREVIVPNKAPKSGPYVSKGYSHERIQPMNVQSPTSTKVPLLANDFQVVFESPDAEHVYCYSPGIIELPSGRLVATLDLGGPGVAQLPGTVRWANGEGKKDWIGKILTSDDGGSTWVHRSDFPFIHARPFIAGDRIFVIGRAEDILIVESADDGETWSAPSALTSGQYWHQSACNVHYAHENVYLVMERRVSFERPGWYVGELAPVLMRANVDDDLLSADSWAFASELPFSTVTEVSDLFGIPFFETGPTSGDGQVKRVMAPMGWLETNVVQIVDPDHVWHDPERRTFHLWMRGHTGSTGYACILKVVENDDGSMTTQVESVPSGRGIVYVPCPGGHMRFHILYDEETRRYWLLSTLPENSMIRPDRLAPDRHGLPNNERQVLALHFSTNMIDWRMAGVVAQGNGPRESRHYASMIFSGDDILVLSRSGDERAKNAHDGNLITLHTVKDFRSLVY